MKGGAPNTKNYWKASKSTYQPKAFSNVNGYNNVYDGQYVDAFLNEEKREIIVAFRGTKEQIDFKSWPNIALSNLSSGARFQEDLRAFEEIKRKYPPNQYKYFVTGHSLGSAIAREMIRKFPFIKAGETFNGANQLKDINDPTSKLKFHYIDKDPLYNTTGKRIKEKKKIYKYHDMGAEGFLNKLKPDFLRSHKLDQFKKYIDPDIRPGIEGTVISPEGGSKEPIIKEPKIEEDDDSEPEHDTDPNSDNFWEAYGLYAFNPEESERYANQLNYMREKVNNELDRYHSEYEDMDDLERMYTKVYIENLLKQIDSYEQNLLDKMENFRLRHGMGLKGGIKPFDSINMVDYEPTHVQIRIEELRNQIRDYETQFNELQSILQYRDLTDEEYLRSIQLDNELTYLESQLWELEFDPDNEVGEEEIDGGAIPELNPETDDNEPASYSEAFTLFDPQHPIDRDSGEYFMEFIERHGLEDQFQEWLRVRQFYLTRDEYEEMEGSGIKEYMNEFSTRSIWDFI